MRRAGRLQRRWLRQCGECEPVFELEREEPGLEALAPGSHAPALDANQLPGRVRRRVST